MEIRVARMCPVHIVSYRCYRAARLASDTEMQNNRNFKLSLPDALNCGFSCKFTNFRTITRRVGGCCLMGVITKKAVIDVMTAFLVLGRGIEPLLQD